MQISNEIKNILKEGNFNGNVYILPKIQLGRKEYLEVNKVLEALGGKWKTRVGHIFNGEQEELELALIEVLENGEIQTLEEIKKQFQFFPTPKKVGEVLIELADIRETDFVLEPSAGQGAIAELIPKCGLLVLNEYNYDNYNILLNKFGDTDINIYNEDFIDFNIDLTFDKIIANPPFSKNQDVKHILKMYSLLNKGGKIIAVASSSIITKNSQYHQELMSLNPQFLELPEGSFKESGTNVNTCVVILEK